MRLETSYLFIILLLIIPVLSSCSLSPKTELLSTEVLIVGGSASGVTAGIQASRSGANVILVEKTPWLGGMLTSAGVSAIDGNDRLPSGLWGEFRKKLRDHYGGPAEVETGWVSNTLFEPKVGNQIWNTLADSTPSLKRIHGYHVVEISMEGETVMGASFVNKAGDSLKIRAKVSIDATELGDLMALSGAKYRTGQDSQENPHDPHIQDLTYSAILQDYGPGNDHTLPKPPNYDPSEFACICLQVCEDEAIKAPNCYTMLTYGRLPNGKFMLNWPNNGNDYYLNALEMSFEERKKAWQAAKDRTLGLIYFLQTEGEFPHLGLAKDEFPTEDHLPLIPYHRESRRVEGIETLKVEDILDPYADPGRPLYQQAIAVGDYPLDHHHDKNPNAPEETFPSIPSFSVPYGSMIPKAREGLLVAEKSISVTHEVNGCSRLQPVVMGIGQAAGAAAALSVKSGIALREVNVTTLQQVLLDAQCWLMPFVDVSPEDLFFQSAQRVGVAGLMRGKGVPFKWANQTFFYPDSLVKKETVLAAIPGEVRPPARQALYRGYLNRIQTVQLLHFLLRERGFDFGEVDATQGPTDVVPNSAVAAFAAQGWLDDWIEGDAFEAKKPMTRIELAFLIDTIFLR